MRTLYLFIILFFLWNNATTSQTITIDNRTFSVDTLSNHKVGPGTDYTALRLTGPARLDVFFIKVDKTDPYISFKAVLGRDSIYGGERTSEMAKRKSTETQSYFAGTNGDFYATDGYVGYPSAGCMVEKQLAKPPTTARYVIAFDEHNVPSIGRMGYSGIVKTNSGQWTINTVNHLREDNRLVLYNQLNGKVTRTNEYGTEVLVQLQENTSWEVNRPVKVKVIKIEKNKGSMPIPEGHGVLSGHGTAAANLNTLSENDELEINLNLAMENGESANYAQIIGGDNRPPMLKDGVIETATVWNEKHPRTGIGYSQTKDTIIFCVIDGRGKSVGATTKELAELMKSAGAYTAFNMDGGGSSTMYIKDFGVMNQTSDGPERAVANGIFAVSTTPVDDVITEIVPYKKSVALPTYGVYMPDFLGFNQYGVLLDKDLKGVSLSCPPELGEILEDGRFLVTGSSSGVLTATYNGAQTEIEINHINEAPIAIRLDSVLLDNKREYPIEVQSVINEKAMDILPKALSWEVEDPSVCSVNDGILKGLANGKTFVYGSLGDFKDTLIVYVEIPDNMEISFDKFEPDKWTMTATSSLGATFGTDNLPADWTYGATVNFNYKASRSPSIKFTRDNLKLYSLPKALKLRMNAGEISIKEVLLSLKANNTTSSVTKKFTNPDKSQDIDLTVEMAELFDTTDIAIFPIQFDYVTYYLNTQTVGTDYTLSLKEIALLYDDDHSGISKTYKPLPGMQLCPNPVDGNLIQVEFNEAIEAPALFVELFDVTGKLVCSGNLQMRSPNQGILACDGLTSGMYVLSININGKTETTKLLKR